MPGGSPEFSDPNLAQKIVDEIKEQVDLQGLSMTEVLRNALSTQRGFEHLKQPPENIDNEQTES